MQGCNSCFGSKIKPYSKFFVVPNALEPMKKALSILFVAISSMIEFLQIEKVFIDRDINDFSPEDIERITEGVYCLDGCNKTKVIVTSKNEVLILSLL